MSDQREPGKRDVDRRQDAPPPAGERSPWALAGLGFQFFASLVLFVYGGTWLDRRFDSSPLFLLVGLFVGAGGSFYLSYRRLTASDRTPR